MRTHPQDEKVCSSSAWVWDRCGHPRECTFLQSKKSCRPHVAPIACPFVKWFDRNHVFLFLQFAAHAW